MGMTPRQRFDETVRNTSPLPPILTSQGTRGPKGFCDILEDDQVTGKGSTSGDTLCGR